MATTLCVKVWVCFVVVCVCISGVRTLYAGDTLVKKMNAAEFEKNVISSKDMFVVEFYADWCGHCQQFAAEYEKVAKALRGIMGVVAVEDKSAMSSYGITGFPTIKLMLGKAGNKPHIIDYQGARSAEALIDFAMTNLTKLAKHRLTAGKGSSSGDAGKKTSGGEKGRSGVVILTDANFDDLVMKDEENIWFVKFYAPWCGHCKAIAPDWEKLANEVKGNVKIGKLDATKESVISTRFQLRGYPTLKLFPAGKKTDASAQTYEEQRSFDAFFAYVTKFSKSTAKALQILNDHMLNEKCQTGVCFLAFLPHILDSGAEKRNEYLATLDEVVKATVSMPINFFWSQGGDQFDLEESLNMAFGYPAVVAINMEKGKYGIHRGNFTRDSMNAFLTGLMAGNVPLQPIPKLEKLKTVEVWDGKDGAVPTDDEL